MKLSIMLPFVLSLALQSGLALLFSIAILSGTNVSISTASNISLWLVFFVFSLLYLLVVYPVFQAKFANAHVRFWCVVLMIWILLSLVYGVTLFCRIPVLSSSFIEVISSLLVISIIVPMIPKILEQIT